jgi:hypothetical protein
MLQTIKKIEAFRYGNMSRDASVRSTSGATLRQFGARRSGVLGLERQPDGNARIGF